ncbi:MAG: hypothetical protein HC919_11415 [Oscillatoriales cyanobacterium SM2_2_1]|nr:hypothetical protein [Oscillatoriales cyanobacterium SM2_2_1]
MAQGLPGMVDLTQAPQLVGLGVGLLQFWWQLAIALGVGGAILALLSFGVRHNPELMALLPHWLGGYRRLLERWGQVLLALCLVTMGFWFCTTLAQRYHFWEQSVIAKQVASVAGDRLEQPAPRVRYVIQEPFLEERVVNGEVVRAQRQRPVNRELPLGSSQVRVTLERASDPQTQRTIYRSDFRAVYQVTNRLQEPHVFYLESLTPTGYTLLQDVVVTQDGRRIDSKERSFRLEPGASTQFTVSYQAQGGPRWVYTANGELLNRFRLDIVAKIPDGEAAGGIVPTERESLPDGVRFAWIYDENVSVQNPFGVFSTAQTLRHTGVIPRLLLLAPGICLVWLLLLSLSMPLSPRYMAIATGMFFMALLALTYLSRLIAPLWAWAIIAPILLTLLALMMPDRRRAIALGLASVPGLAVPIVALLVPYTGLTLALAGGMGCLWLAIAARVPFPVAGEPES